MLDKSQIKKYLKGDLLPDDLQKWQQYLQQDDLSALEELMQEDWEEMPLETTTADVPTETLYTQIQEQISPVLGRWSWIRGGKILAIAASVVLVALVFLLRNQLTGTASPKLVQNESNTIKKVLLEDGSVVWLNEKSSISYQFSRKGRKLELKGEAFFVVRRDVRRPFSVKTGKLTTTVLGTRFNIEAFAEDERVAVSLTSGKVKVEIDDDQVPRNWELAPGDQLEYLTRDGVAQKNQFNTIQETAWMNGRVVLEKTPLSNALKEISRFYHTSLRFDTLQLQKCKVTSTFDKSDPIDEVLTVLLFSNNLTYKKQGQGYIIEGLGCN